MRPSRRQALGLHPWNQPVVDGPGPWPTHTASTGGGAIIADPTDKTLDCAVGASDLGAERRTSWALPAPEGAYARIPAWSSADDWIDQLTETLDTTAGESARRSIGITRDTFLAVAEAEAESADRSTGRNVTTAHETVAASTRLSVITVRRARRLLELLGFAVTVVRGRYMTDAERAEAHALHGGRQIRAASTRALTLPRPPRCLRRHSAVDNEHLPGSYPGTSSSHLRSGYPSARKHAPKAASRPARTTECAPRPIMLQRLAAKVAVRVPWITRRGHIGLVCDVLVRAGVDPAQWTAAGLLAAMDARARDDDWKIIDPTYQRAPLAYFALQLRRTIEAGAEPDIARAARLRADRRQSAERRRADEAGAPSVPMPPDVRDVIDAIRCRRRYAAKYDRSIGGNQGRAGEQATT